MKTNLYVLSFIVFGLTACGNSSHEENPYLFDQGIIGGTETPKTHATSKHLVLIFDKPTESYCTAMLVRKNVLMTAAHCIKSGPTAMTVAFGTRPMTGDYVIREATRVVVHPLYKNNSVDRNDLALILMKTEAPPGYEPLELPPDDFPFKAGMSFTASGYGRITGVTDPSGDNQGSGLLRHVDLKIDSFSEDQSQFYVNQSDSKGICSGDSGGPAIMVYKNKDYAVGIASAISWRVPSELSDKAKKEYIEKQNICAYKSIYISTKKFRPWIEKGIQELLQ